MTQPSTGIPRNLAIASRWRDRLTPWSWRRHRVLTGAGAVVGLGLLVMVGLSDVSAAARLVGAALALVATVGLALLTSSESAVSRGVGALIAGIIGISVGAAIGLVWLVTSGPSLVALVTTTALVAGLLLLASGTWLLVRATPGRWRLAAIPVAFLILQFILIPLAGAVYGTHPPSTPMSAPLPADARAVHFETTDGAAHTAWYTPSRNGAVVIVLSGSGGDKGSTVEHARVLVEHDYGVLALDSRGSGESGGVGNAWGWHGPADVAGAVAWLGDQDSVDPGRIGALGLSMGGEVAITAASETGLAVVVAEGVSARVPADLAFLPSDATGIIERVDGEIMWAVAALLTDAVPPMPLTEAVAQAAGVPMLVIVGSDPDEAAAARLLLAARPSLEVWEIPDTPHIQSLALHPAEWETRVIGFLDANLCSQGCADPVSGPG